MGITTRADDLAKKMRRSTSGSKLLAMVTTRKGKLAPQKPVPPPKPAPAPTQKPAPAEKAAPPPRLSSRLPARVSNNARTGVAASRRKSITRPGVEPRKTRLDSNRTPSRRSSGRLPKPTKTPGWASPTEDSFRRPIPNGNRRTSIYQKRIRQSLLEGDIRTFSPSKTRRRSVYGVVPSRSPPRPRRSMALTSLRVPSTIPSPVTERLPSIDEPVPEPEPSVEPAPKKRRPVCGVAALRRKSALPEALRAAEPVVSRPEADGSVEIVDLETTPRGEPADFFTPAAKDANSSIYQTPAVKNELNSSLYQTPAVKSSSSRRRNIRSDFSPVLVDNDENVTVIETSQDQILNSNDEKHDSSKCIIS